MADTINLAITENSTTVNLTISEFLSTGTGGATNHSDLVLDDGTNPHGTTASDVGALTSAEVTTLLNSLKSSVQTASVSGTVDIDLSAYDTFVITMTGATTFNFINVPPDLNANKRTFTMWVTGAFVFSFTGATTIKVDGATDYDGTKDNVIVFDVLSTNRIEGQLTVRE